MSYISLSQISSLAAKLLFTVSLLCVSAHSIAAQQEQLCNDKVFYADDMSPSPHDHYDKRILVLSGIFGDSAANNVRWSIRQTNSYDEVWLCSPGGSVKQGMDIGRELSAARATVRVPQGFRCVSACTIAFLGGFVRIIEPDSQYIVHASSAYLDLDKDKLLLLKCGEPEASRVCSLFLNVFDTSKDRCKSVDEIKDSNSHCLILDPEPDSATKSLIVIRQPALLLIPIDREVLTVFANQLVDDEVESSIELLRYYQEMLLSGNTAYIRNLAYRNLENQFRPKQLYDPANFGADARDLASDVSTINNSDTLTGKASVWHSILTDSELNVKRQLVKHIQSSDLSFGPAGLDAVKILEAMIVCQIQTYCRLQTSEAAALGIHNVFDAK